MAAPVGTAPIPEGSFERKIYAEPHCLVFFPAAAAEELLEIVMRRYERTRTLLTSNRPVEDWGKLLGDSAAITAMLDRLLHHGHILKCGPRSWRTKTGLPRPLPKG